MRNLIFLCMAFALFSNAIAAEPEWLGHWRTTRILGVAEIASLSKQDANRLVGKKLVVATNRMSFAGSVCLQSPVVSAIEDDAKALREQWHVSSANMGLIPPLKELDFGCTSLFFSRASPGRLVIHWEGYFFEARRARPEAR